MRPQRGIIQDGIFRNDYFKIAIPVKEDVYIYNDSVSYDQLKAAGMPVTEATMELADGAFSFEEMEKVFMGRNRDFALMGAENKYSLVVQYDNMDMTMGARYTAEQCAELMGNQFKQKDPQADVSMETMYLGWLEYCRVTIFSGGIQYNYYFRAQDEYMVIVGYMRYDGDMNGREEFEISIP